MSEPLVFMMGEFAAQFPTDRKYATNHMWATEAAGTDAAGTDAAETDATETDAAAGGPEAAGIKTPGTQPSRVTTGHAAYRFGFTAYAVRLLQDVYFLEWLVDPGVSLRHRQEMGAIESKKAESALYAPLAGKLSRLNDELLADPSTINVDKYGAGWLFELEDATGELLTPEQYLEHLAAVWEITQRTIKGQLNE